MKLLASLILAALFLGTADAAPDKTIQLLDGKAWFAVPKDLLSVNRQLGPGARYVDLVALVSADHQISVLATYGNYAMRRMDLQTFLDAKINSYDKRKNEHRYFHWINHGLLERQGREWAQISFAHDVPAPAGGETYARSISTVLEGHLLELGAVCHSGQRSVVDRIIESLQVPRSAAPVQHSQPDRSPYNGFRSVR